VLRKSFGITVTTGVENRSNYITDWNYDEECSRIRKGCKTSEVNTGLLQLCFTARMRPPGLSTNWPGSPQSGSRSCAEKSSFLDDVQAVLMLESVAVHFVGEVLIHCCLAT